jgi:hypothetical protein
MTVKPGEAMGMLMSDLVSTIHVIDTDTHVVKPPDLWTSRVPVSATVGTRGITFRQDRTAFSFIAGLS